MSPVWDARRRGIARHLLLGCAVIALAGCTRAMATSAAPFPDTRKEVRSWVADRLVFGLAIPGGGAVSDSAWTAFFREIVTPRFPSGLTIWRAEGQWLDPHGVLVDEPVVVVEVFHAPDTPPDSVFEAIARTYRVRFKQDAVLRTSVDVRSRFYDDPLPAPR